MCSTILYVLALAALIAPLALIAVAALADPSAWAPWNEANRLGSLIAQTLGLAAVASVIAVPFGMLAAFAFERASIPGARLLRGVVLVSLFVPLPVLAVASQIVLGSWLPSLALAPGDVAWRPWSQGLLPAGIVHGFAALPWVIVIVGAGLRTCDRVLEEDALVIGGPWMAIRRVLLPRALLAAVAAFGWVIVQTATEIPVTDAMMVRTFAEEVYTQIVSGGGVHAAVIVALPGLLISIAAATLLTRWLAKRFPNNPEATARSRPLVLGTSTRLLLCVFVYSLMAIIAVLPLVALLWKAAGGGTSTLSLTFAVEQIGRAVQLNGRVLLQSLVAAALTGIVTAWLATVLAWSARTSLWRMTALLIVAVSLALTPGPIVGQGLKESINALMDVEDRVLHALGLSLTFPPLRSLLYDQPSPVPTMLAGLLRFLPLALLIVAPVMRALPRDLLDLAKLDGGNAWRLVGRPFTARATLLAAVAVAGLTLGEVSAGKQVAPPGWRLFILDLFDQMHYGAEPMVAAMCLVQIGLIFTLLTLSRLPFLLVRCR